MKKPPIVPLLGYAAADRRQKEGSVMNDRSLLPGCRAVWATPDELQWLGARMVRSRLQIRRLRDQRTGAFSSNVRGEHGVTRSDIDPMALRLIGSITSAHEKAALHDLCWNHAAALGEHPAA